VFRLPHIVQNKLIGLTTAVPADRFHIFHSLTFEKLSLAGKLSMFSIYLYLCVHTYAVHTYAVMCVKWNTIAISECFKSEINTFSLALTKIIAVLFFTTQLINISKNFET